MPLLSFTRTRNTAAVRELSEHYTLRHCYRYGMAWLQDASNHSKHGLHGTLVQLSGAAPFQF
jgi:hypothetical protein